MHSLTGTWRIGFYDAEFFTDGAYVLTGSNGHREDGTYQVIKDEDFRKGNLKSPSGYILQMIPRRDPPLSPIAHIFQIEEWEADRLQLRSPLKLAGGAYKNQPFEMTRQGRDQPSP